MVYYHFGFKARFCMTKPLSGSHIELMYSCSAALALSDSVSLLRGMFHHVAPSLFTSCSFQCHTVRRQLEEFAAALHLFSGCCLSVCFVLSSCVFKRQFLPARDTWKEPWHEQKTSPQRRGGGGGWNDNTRRETRPRNKLRLNWKTIKLQRWEE